MKNNAKHINYNFSKNLFYHIIAPAIIFLVSLVLLFTVNFNLGLDFKGGSLATVVIENQDLENSETYNNVKQKVDKICKDNDITIKLYQKVKTSYYGDAITVKFDRISDEVRTALKEDLKQAFYPTLTDEYELDTFIKVDNFEGSVSKNYVPSAILAILVVAVIAYIYITARHGWSAGFVSLTIMFLDIVLVIGLTLITRVKVEMGTIASIVVISMYSLILNVLFFNKANENLKKEKYVGMSNGEIANVTVKENLPLTISTTLIMLVFSLILGVVPTALVRSTSLPLLFGVLGCGYTSTFIMPGLWSALFFKSKRRKAKEAKEAKEKEEVVVEEKQPAEEIKDAPEVIVETETKETDDIISTDDKSENNNQPEEK